MKSISSKSPCRLLKCWPLPGTSGSTSSDSTGFSAAKAVCNCSSEIPAGLLKVLLEAAKLGLNE